MKLRIKGNTLRIRIQQQELLRLEKAGHLTDSISFGPMTDQCLEYRLIKSDTSSDLVAGYAGNRISVSIPTEVVTALITSQRVGIETVQPIAENKSLKLLVEKDFKCLTPRAEDADAFPHPEEEQGHRP